MRNISGILLIAGIIVTASVVRGQPPGRPDGGGRPGSSSGDAGTLVSRMMTLDANGDGKLSKDEVTDARLTALFDRADADHDGVVTKEELTTLFGKELSSGGRGGPDGGPGGRGRGPGGNRPGGPGGPGGRGGPGGPPPIGQVLPPHVQEMLNLSKAQKTKLDALQKRVDTALQEILTDEQKHQIEEMRNHEPGGPGGPDGERDGFGPPPGGNRGGPPGGGRPPRPPE